MNLARGYIVSFPDGNWEDQSLCIVPHHQSCGGTLKLLTSKVANRSWSPLVQDVKELYANGA